MRKTTCLLSALSPIFAGTIIVQLLLMTASTTYLTAQNTSTAITRQIAPVSVGVPSETVHELSTDVVVYGYDFLEGKVLKGYKRIALRGFRFVVVDGQLQFDSLGRCYVVKFWNIAQSSETDLANKVLSAADNGKYFLLKAADFTEGKYTETRVSKWTFASSMQVLPIKIRFGNGEDRPFDYNNDVTIGGAMGARYHLTPYAPHYLVATAGLGLSAISVDSTSTRGLISSSADYKLSAISPNVGLLYEYAHFQAGIFLGFDFTPRRAAHYWVYQGRPWLSVGIGYQFISRSFDKIDWN